MGLFFSFLFLFFFETPRFYHVVTMRVWKTDCLVFITSQRGAKPTSFPGKRNRGNEVGNCFVSRTKNRTLGTRLAEYRPVVRVVITLEIWRSFSFHRVNVFFTNIDPSLSKCVFKRIKQESFRYEWEYDRPALHRGHAHPKCVARRGSRPVSTVLRKTVRLSKNG